MDEQLLVIYNASDKNAMLRLPEGEWMVLADGQDTDCCKQVPFAEDVTKAGGTEDRRFKVPAQSGMILGKIR